VRRGRGVPLRAGRAMGRERLGIGCRLCPSAPACTKHKAPLCTACRSFDHSTPPSLARLVEGPGHPLRPSRSLVRRVPPSSPLQRSPAMVPHVSPPQLRSLACHEGLSPRTTVCSPPRLPPWYTPPTPPSSPVFPDPPRLPPHTQTLAGALLPSMPGGRGERGIMAGSDHRRPAARERGCAGRLQTCGAVEPWVGVPWVGG
jgi:hypothetical protein